MLFSKKYTWNFFTFSSKTTKRAIHQKMNRPPFSYYFPFRKYAQYLFSLSVISTYLAFPVLGTLGTITSSDFLLHENGSIKKGDVSESTVNRYINLLALKLKTTSNQDMRRYERPHINEVWCGDSSIGS